MTALWLLARVQLRRRWVGLLVLGGMVALVSAVTLTALAGARRTASTVDRFRDWADASDVWYQTSSPEQMPALVDALRADPAVESVTPRSFVTAFPDDAPFLELETDPEGALGVSQDRVRLLRGRLPAAGSPDEITLNELAADLLGADVGSTVSVSTWTPDDIGALGGSSFPGFNGPRLDLQVVGVGRAPSDLSQDLRAGSPVGLVSPGFLAAHPDVGSWPPAATVRMRDPSQLDRVTALAVGITQAGAPVGSPGAGSADGSGGGTEGGGGDQGYFPAQESAANAYQTDAQHAVDGLAVGLVLFGAAAALAGGVVVAQAASREVAGRADMDRSLRSLGYTRRQRAVALAAPVATAGAVGALVGAVASIPLSALLPTGLARRAEVDPGPWVDPLVLGVGSVLVVVALTAWAATAARRLGQAAPTAARAPSRLTRASIAAGAPISVVTGVRFAADRGRGQASLRSRPAMAAVALAVAGILASAVLARSLDDLVADPGHWGWNWSTLPDVAGDAPPDEVAAAVAQDRRVAGVGELVSTTVVLQGVPLGGYAMRAIKGDMALTRVSGRLPSGPGEVALGRSTMRGFGLSEGDVVAATATDGSSVELTVVGEAVMPPTDITSIAEGAVLTPDGLEVLGQGDATTSLALRDAPGVDAASLERDLSDRYGMGFGPYTEASVPSAVRDVTDTRDIGLAIGGFFAVLGVLGLAHALVVSARRRRVDVAVLRTLGLRRRGVTTVMVSQALAITAVGLLVGVPIGLIVGRAVWHALVDHLGIVAVPQQPWLATAVVVPAALATGALLAWWPGRRLHRRPPARALRAE